MSLTHWRHTNSFRIASALVLLNFLISQNIYAQDQYHVQEGIHIYTPVEKVDAKRLDERSGSPTEAFGDDSLVRVAGAGIGVLPNPNDFWNESFEMLDLNLFISFLRQRTHPPSLWRSGGNATTL